jgi:uncharacterized membrane protein
MFDFLPALVVGMDPYSRRATWDLLKKKKEGRVIILTTHFSQYINSHPFHIYSFCSFQIPDSMLYVYFTFWLISVYLSG